MNIKPPKPKMPKEKKNDPKRIQPFSRYGNKVQLPKTPRRPAGVGSKSSNRNK